MEPVSKLGLVKDGCICSTETIPALSGNGLKPRLPVIRDTIIDLCNQLGINGSDCSGIVISSPGVNEDNLRIVSINEKYNDAVGLDLQKWALDAFGLPLFIENDARNGCYW